MSACRKAVRCSTKMSLAASTSHTEALRCSTSSRACGPRNQKALSEPPKPLTSSNRYIPSQLLLNFAHPPISHSILYIFVASLSLPPILSHPLLPPSYPLPPSLAYLPQNPLPSSLPCLPQTLFLPPLASSYPLSLSFISLLTLSLPTSHPFASPLHLPSSSVAATFMNASPSRLSG